MDGIARNGFVTKIRVMSKIGWLAINAAHFDFLDLCYEYQENLNFRRYAYEKGIGIIFGIDLYVVNSCL